MADQELSALRRLKGPLVKSYNTRIERLNKLTKETTVDLNLFQEHLNSVEEAFQKYNDKYEKIIAALPSTPEGNLEADEETE